MDARDAALVQLGKISRVPLVSAGASVDADENEKDGDAHHERHAGSHGLRREGEEPRCRQNGEDERREPRHSQQLAAAMRARGRRVELGGAFLVPGGDLAVVAGDQDLSSFSDR
jgi:hypothetical protein